MVLRIARSLKDRIVADCAVRLPIEGCGVVSAGGRFVPLANAEKSLHLFSFDPGEQLRVWRELDAAGDRVLIVYHSHPDGAAVPSRTDALYAAAYPDVHHVVVGRPRSPQCEVRSWVWDGTGLVEEGVELADG